MLLPAVAEPVGQLRASGVKVALQTGYRREIAEGLLDAVGWKVGHDVERSSPPRT